MIKFKIYIYNKLFVLKYKRSESSDIIFIKLWAFFKY